MLSLEPAAALLENRETEEFLEVRMQKNEYSTKYVSVLYLMDRLNKAMLSLEKPSLSWKLRNPK